MIKTFTQLTQYFSVTKAGHITCPYVVCTTATANNIKNNYKDDLANAGSFSFIEPACHAEPVEEALREA